MYFFKVFENISILFLKIVLKMAFIFTKLLILLAKVKGNELN